MADQTPDSRRTALAVAAVLALMAPAAAVAANAPAAVAPATEGADTIVGTPLADELHAKGGDDSVRGMDGDDKLFGNEGNDSLGGSPGEDELHGGRGSDQLNGGMGDDTLSGDRDDDTLTGGLGADRFLFDADSGDDVITDFNPLDGDQIQFPQGADYRVTDTPEGLSLQIDGGGRLLVRGMRYTAMGEHWAAIGPPPAPPIPPHLITVANPPAAPSKLLLGIVVGLGAAFVVLLAIGLAQLLRGQRERR
jgi:hypothetical protein